MSNLYGYAEVDKDFEQYIKPIILIGPEGTGKKTWIDSVLPKERLVLETTASKADLDYIFTILSSNADFVWVIDIDRLYNIAYLKMLLKSAPQSVTVLAYTTMDISSDFLDVASIHFVPLLDDSQMRTLCLAQGLGEDETDFTVRASGGVPGNIHKSFEMLRSRKVILNFLESVRDNDYRAVLRTIDEIKDRDMELLGTILTSFKTGVWTYFAESEVEPLRRIEGVLELCLWECPLAYNDVAFATIAFSALHAYHGRV